jgi:hypothetical protein
MTLMDEHRNRLITSIQEITEQEKQLDKDHTEASRAYNTSREKVREAAEVVEALCASLETMGHAPTLPKEVVNRCQRAKAVKEAKRPRPVAEATE